MAGLGDIFGSIGIGGGGGGIGTLLMYMLFGLVAIGTIGGSFWWWYAKRKKWWMTVEVKMPRGLNYLTKDDGSLDPNKVHALLNAEIAQGTYDARKGVVLIKRHKKRPVPMKPFDVKRYLQGSNVLTVVQVGIEDYRPVLNESYIEMIDEETGEEAALIKTKIDTSESKAWKEYSEREGKNAYSITNMLKEYAPYIGFGILFFMNFVGFAILYGRIK